MKRSRRLAAAVAGASTVAVALGFLTAAPAAAQTSSPPGFGDCPPIGGPVGNQLAEIPVIFALSPNPHIGLRGSADRYVDKLVYDAPRDRYIHARYDARWDTWQRVGCKPKPPNEKPADVPRFGGGGGGGYADARHGGFQIRVFAGGGTVRTGKVTVGPLENISQQ